MSITIRSSRRFIVRKITDIHDRVVLMRQQRFARDYEAAAGTRTEIYEATLRAIAAGRVPPKSAARVALAAATVETPGWG